MKLPLRPSLRRSPRAQPGSAGGSGLFSRPLLGKAFAVSAGLHGAVAVGALAWVGFRFLNGGDRPVPAAIQVLAPPPLVAATVAAPPLELTPPLAAEPELLPVFEEEAELFPVDWMDRPVAHPRRADLRAVERPRPEEAPAAPAELPEEPPEPSETATEAVPDAPGATVTASPASVVEASYDPDPELSPPPRYPSLAIRRGWEGTVLLEATISADGRLIGLEVLRSTGRKLLDEAALEAVRKWKPGAFRPAMQDGIAVEGKVPIQFRFQISATR